MIAAVVVSCLLAGNPQQGQVVVQGGPPPAPVPRNAPTKLPDSPQAKHVQAYIDAFNSGDEAKFLKTQEQLMSPDVLEKRPADQRAKMYARIRGDFGTLRVLRVATATNQIRVVMPDKDGNEAIFSFDFEATAPYRIKGIGVDIGNVER